MLQHGQLLGDVSAFMKSRVILTGGELDLFTRLDGKPATAVELSKELGLNPGALIRILDALVAFALLEKTGASYSLTGQGSLLSSKHPESVLPMVLHMNRLWDSWGRLSAMGRKGGRARMKRTVATDEKGRKSFIGAMHVIGRELSVEIAGSYDLRPFRRLLDIGGASGTYTISFLTKNPGMKAVIYDLPSVIPMAKERIEAEGLVNRVEFTEGDFYKDELPKGCDLALLSAIIHQNSASGNVDLYRKIFRALEPGGTILIRDHIMDDSRTRPAPGTLFAINMLVNTRGGSTYTFMEVKETLEKAGFKDARLLRTGDKMDCLVDARKP